MHTLPDITSPDFQRLTMGLSRIARAHPQVGETDPDRIQRDLILRSLLVLPLLEPKKPVIDLGSGVGIPGLILAIANPEQKIYLLEPKTKSIALLRWLLNRLDCENVEIIHARVQDADLNKYGPLQVVTRSALNWQQIDNCCPDSFDPRIRWSGPSVQPPPKTTGRVSALLTANHKGISQQFYWWGKEKLFHVKQSEWNSLPWITYSTT